MALVCPLDVYAIHQYKNGYALTVRNRLQYIYSLLLHHVHTHNECVL